MKFEKKVALLALVLLLLDQLSKFLIRYSMFIGQSQPIIRDVFHLTFVTNTGISFGMFKGNNWIFIIISIAVLAYIIWNIDEFKDSFVAASFIIAGVLGNLADRIFLGYVVDFMDFRVWPIFNFADLFINIGVILIIILSFKKKPFNT